MQQGNGHPLCALVMILTVCGAGGQWRGVGGGGGGVRMGKRAGRLAGRQVGGQTGGQTGGEKLRLTMAKAHLFKVQALPTPHSCLTHSSSF